MEHNNDNFRFKGLPGERITVEYVYHRINHFEEMKVTRHSHDFFELIFVKSGLCEHTFKDSSVTLMSNDVLLVLPNQSHSFEFSEQIEIYNCQFYQDALQDDFAEIANTLSYPSLRTTASEYTQTAFEKDSEISKAFSPEQFVNLRFAPLNLQGIIHTSFSQALFLENLFKKIMAEQEYKPSRYQNIVSNCLEETLIFLERIMTNQFKYDDEIPQKHMDTIESVLKYIDSNYQEHLNFNDIASAQDLSPNYFRKIFKSYTGTSPLVHLNRIRVLKALEILRDYNYSNTDVAAKVGIYDANYFTRLFKKYTGFPPSHFSKNKL